MTIVILEWADEIDFMDLQSWGNSLEETPLAEAAGYSYFLITKI